MRNVYGTYQNVNRFSEMISVKVFRTDPYIYIYREREIAHSSQTY